MDFFDYFLLYVTFMQSSLALAWLWTMTGRVLRIEEREVQTSHLLERMILLMENGKNDN